MRVDYQNIPEIELPLRVGGSILFRRLRPEDRSGLEYYFGSFSEQSRKWFKPHSFTDETIKEVCEIEGRDNILRMIALTSSREQEVAAYFILNLGTRPQAVKRLESCGTSRNDSSDCALAPSVSDSYQNMGLGSLLLKEMINIAKSLNKNRMQLWGGVDMDNTRAIHFYEKFGFCKTDISGKNDKYAMILDLYNEGS